MAAVADLLDDVAHKRRILMVMTDGIADNPKLCEDVITVLEARGVEGVAIGINNDSVRKWCRNSHVIEDISQLPQALLDRTEEHTSELQSIMRITYTVFCLQQKTTLQEKNAK